MTDTPALDNMRRKALDDVTYWERGVKMAIAAAAVCEAGLGLTFILLLDFSNNLHLLLLFAVATVYVPLVFVMFSLYCNINRNTGRILKAIELLDANRADDTESP